MQVLTSLTPQTGTRLPLVILREDRNPVADEAARERRSERAKRRLERRAEWLDEQARKRARTARASVEEASGAGGASTCRDARAVAREARRRTLEGGTEGGPPFKRTRFDAGRRGT